MGALKPLSLSSSSILRAIRPFVAPLKPSASSPRCIIVSRRVDRGYRCSLSAMKGRCLSTLVNYQSSVETVMEYESDQPCDDGRLMKREATLHFALSQLAGDFDKESNLSLQRFFCTRRTPVISTGSLKLDMALGAGGLPKGRMIEIYGTEASGKTTLALHIVKEAQKLGGYCAYLDVENAMNPSLAEAMGVHTDNLLIAHPNSAENTLNIVNTLVNSGSVDVIVVDSVAALIPQRELDGMIGDHSRDMQARLMTQALRKIHYSLSRSQTLIIFINQVRMNPKPYQHFDQMSEVTCGGNALKFYAAIRMRISRRGLLQTHDEVTGITIAVQVMKNKLAPTMKKATIDIGFGKGILQEAEVLEMASKHGIITQEGNGYWINGEFFTDQPEAEQYLLDNSSAAEELVSILRNQLFEMRA